MYISYNISPYYRGIIFRFSLFWNRFSRQTIRENVVIFLILKALELYYVENSLIWRVLHRFALRDVKFAKTVLNPRQSQLVYQVWTHDKYNTERFVDNIKIHLATTTQQPSAESKFGHVSCVRVSYGLFRTNHFWTRIRFTLIEIRRDSFEMLKPARWENAVCKRFSRFLRDSMTFFSHRFSSPAAIRSRTYFIVRY